MLEPFLTLSQYNVIKAYIEREQQAFDTKLRNEPELKSFIGGFDSACNSCILIISQLTKKGEPNAL